MKKEPAAKRGFVGILIKRNIYLSSQLKPMEKFLLGEIEALDDPTDGCYASNAHFAEFLGVSQRYVRKMISHLFELGLIDVRIDKGQDRCIRIEAENMAVFGKKPAQKNVPEGGTTVPGGEELQFPRSRQ